MAMDTFPFSPKTRFTPNKHDVFIVRRNFLRPSGATTKASQTPSARRRAANRSDDLYISLYPCHNIQLLGKSLSIHRPKEYEWDVW